MKILKAIKKFFRKNKPCEDESWGVGNAAKDQAFDKISVQVGGDELHEEFELIFGEHPHTRDDNNIYARAMDGDIMDFDGHRMPIEISIKEYNYLTNGSFSGYEIRKGCNLKVFVSGIQICDEFARNYESAYKKAQRLIYDLEDLFTWFPLKTDEWVGKTITFYEQPCIIERFIIDQCSIIIRTKGGEPFKKHVWDDDEYPFAEEPTIKVEITSPHIWWFYWFHEEK